MPDSRDELIAQYIDESLRQVLDQYAKEELPSEIVDLLTLLKAQDRDRTKSES